jgi:hypothetical protein
MRLTFEVCYRHSPHKQTVKRRLDSLLRQMHPSLILCAPVSEIFDNGIPGGIRSICAVMEPNKITVAIWLNPAWAGRPAERLMDSLKKIKNVASVALTFPTRSDTMPPCESHPNTAPTSQPLATSPIS